jgi:prepilin-type processing-associated H-X9-DG protein
MLVPYQQSKQVQVCPSAPKLQVGNYAAGGYGCNFNLMWMIQPNPGPPGNPTFGGARHLAEITDAAGTFVICDTAQCTKDVVGQDPSTWNNFVNRTSPTTDWEVFPPGNWDNDNDAHYTVANQWGDETRRPVPRHNGGLNAVYADGHAKWSEIHDFVGPMPKGWPYGHPKNSWDNR